MFAAIKYRTLLDRFFVLTRMEKLATTKLRIATDMRGDETLLASVHEELRLIHQEKLKLIADLQALMLSSSTSSLFTAQVQWKAEAIIES